MTRTVNVNTISRIPLSSGNMTGRKALSVSIRALANTDHLHNSAPPPNRHPLHAEHFALFILCNRYLTGKTSLAFLLIIHIIQPVRTTPATLLTTQSPSAGAGKGFGRRFQHDA